MIADDTTRRRDEGLVRGRRTSGFLESQGAHGIGWAATHGANGIGWAASQDPMQRDAYRASRASLARSEAEVPVIREMEHQRPVTRPGVTAPFGSDAHLR